MLSVQPNPLGTTEPYNSVSPISLQERHLATCFCIFLIQLHSMNLVLDQHPIQLAALFCDSMTKPIMTKIQKNPSWKFMSKGKREITSKLNHIYRGREYSRRESNHQGPQMLGIQEERSHMSSRGERHVHICSIELALFIPFELCFLL